MENFSNFLDSSRKNSPKIPLEKIKNETVWGRLQTFALDAAQTMAQKESLEISPDQQKQLETLVGQLRDSKREEIIRLLSSVDTQAEIETMEHNIAQDLAKEALTVLKKSKQTLH